MSGDAYLKDVMCKQEERDSSAFGSIPADGAEEQGTAGVNATSPSDRTGRTKRTPCSCRGPLPRIPGV